MTAEVIYTGNLRTQATHLNSSQLLETDAPIDNQGLGERFSPTDLVASALASCMLTIMGIAARTHEISIEQTRASVEKLMIADPRRRIAEIRIHVYFPPELRYTEKEQKILEQAALTCPVYLSLHPETLKTVHFHWPE